MTANQGSAESQVTVVIVDDEPLARASLRELLDRHAAVVRVVGEAACVDEAELLIADTKPDAVFLDVQMPGCSGFDLLPRLCLSIRVVFVTAYDRYAVRAFRVNALDYLLKPIDRASLAEAVRRLQSRRPGAEAGSAAPGTGSAPPLTADDNVLIDTRVRCFLVPVATIAAVRAMANYSEVILDDGARHSVRQTLLDWEARLPGELFLRLDRSVILNLSRLRAWQPLGRQMQIRCGSAEICMRLGRRAASRLRDEVARRKKPG